MRMIHATVDPESSGSLETALEEANATYSRMPAVDEEGRQLWVIAVAMDQVEPLLEAIRSNRDSPEDFVVVSEVEAILSDTFEEHQEEVEEEDDETQTHRISREELVTRAEALSRGTSNFMLFTIISGIVATVGLLTNSAAVVVGSMVIAPLIGPAMASSVATVVNDNEMFWDGVKTQTTGVAVAVISSGLFALLLRFTILPDVELLLLEQVAERVHPGPLALVVALGAGIAGALSITSGMSAALVGVMIAVALIPPAAAFGLGLAYYRPVVAVSSGVLVLLNLFSINLAGLGTLWFKGYRPERWFETKVAWSATLRRSLFLAVMVVFLTGALAFATYHEHVNAGIKQSTTKYLEEHDVETMNISMDYEFNWWYRTPHRISLQAINPPEGLANNLHRYLERKQNRSLEIRVIDVSVTIAGDDA
ncbi:MAG: TIGR00341 family protein [bacterium]